MRKITITEEGHSWLVSRIDLIIAKMYKEPANFELDFISMIYDLKKSLAGEELEAPPEEIKKKPRARASSSPIVIKNGCPEHPTYGAKRRPRTSCNGCWDAFKKYNPTSYQKAWREFQRKNQDAS